MGNWERLLILIIGIMVGVLGERLNVEQCNNPFYRADTSIVCYYDANHPMELVCKDFAYGTTKHISLTRNEASNILKLWQRRWE